MRANISCNWVFRVFSVGFSHISLTGCVLFASGKYGNVKTSWFSFLSLELLTCWIKDWLRGRRGMIGGGVGREETMCLGSQQVSSIKPPFLPIHLYLIHARLCLSFHLMLHWTPSLSSSWSSRNSAWTISSVSRKTCVQSSVKGKKFAVYL